jgi:hypothetical protein
MLSDESIKARERKKENQNRGEIPAKVLPPIAMFASLSNFLYLASNLLSSSPTAILVISSQRVDQLPHL